MKKFLAIAAIAALMVSCNGDKSAEATTETADTAAVVATPNDTTVAAAADTTAAATVDTAAKK